MANRQTIPAANTRVNRNMVSGQMLQANRQSTWRAPSFGGVLAQAADTAAQYYQGERDAAFKRLDLEAGKMQMGEMESIRVAESNEAIPEIENAFKTKLNDTFSQDNWGKMWLKERGGIFLALNSRDVQRAGIAKQKELYSLRLNETLNTWADDISNSAEDKARVLMGDMTKYIDNSTLLSPEEKQKTKDNALALTLQKQISKNPQVAMKMLDDESYKWGEKGIDTEKYKASALASIKNAGQKRLIKQINDNRAAASGLIDKSMTERLSLDEINTAVPESSAELRAFLYDINGYSKEDVENGGIKLTEEEKAINAENLQIKLSGLIGNPETSIEDWQKYENEVYRMMNNKSINRSSGIDLLNNFATPFMEAYQNKLNDAGNNHFFSADFGYKGLNKWIEKNILPNPVKKSDYKNNMTTYKKLESGQARIRADIYQQYNAALIQVAKNAGLRNVAEIKTLTSQKQDEIYRAAQESVQNNWSLQEFIRLRNIPPEMRPNAVLNKGELVNSSNNMDNAKKGIPVKNTGWGNVGKYKVRVIEK